MKNFFWLIGLLIALLFSNSVKAQQYSVYQNFAIHPSGSYVAVWRDFTGICNDDPIDPIVDDIKLFSYPELEFLSSIDIENVNPCVGELLEWSRDGRYLVVSEGIGSAYVWDSHEKRVISHSYPFGMDQRYGDAFKPDGTLIANTSWGAGVVLWDPFTGEDVKRLFEREVMVMATWSPDGKYLLTSRSEDKMRKCLVLETENFTQVASFSCDSWSSLWSGDGTFIITIGKGVLRVWNAQTFELKHEWFYEMNISEWALMPDDQSVVLALGDEGLEIWDIETGQKVFAYNPDYPIYTFDVSAQDSTILYWDATIENMPHLATLSRSLEPLELTATPAK